MKVKDNFSKYEDMMISFLSDVDKQKLLPLQMQNIKWDLSLNSVMRTLIRFFAYNLCIEDIKYKNKIILEKQEDLNVK